MSGQEQTAAGSRLLSLLGFLRQDPSNLQLIADAAAAAQEEGDPGVAAELLEQYAVIAPLPSSLVNLEGLLALQTQRFEDAARIFESLLPANPDNPALRFNLAWARIMTRDYDGGLDLLDDATVSFGPHAATLKVQALHYLGRLQEALDGGAAYAERFAADPPLMGALAVAAFDSGQFDLAKRYAVQAGARPDGLSTLGMLLLQDNDVDEAAPIFDQALSSYPGNARALVGKGITQLAKGDAQTAARSLEHGAEIFRTHLGSWVAAGWAYFVGGDYVTSRATFEKALAIDDTFAETHGALAVLDMLEGDIASAKHRTEIALRLDNRCFSGALAKSLIMDSEGDRRSAERIRNIALNAAIGPSGRTLAQAMASFGSGQGARNGAAQT